jgi:hypothetical protein
MCRGGVIFNLSPGEDLNPDDLRKLVTEHLDDKNLIIMCLKFSRLCCGQLRERLDGRNTFLRHIIDILFGADDPDEEKFTRIISRFTETDVSHIRKAFDQKYDPKALKKKYATGVKRQKMKPVQYVELDHLTSSFHGALVKIIVT